ncbi:hypothetical protein O181_073480 [Austropuccinia psidii MF-1]|uniref:Uncharacterized protein n=1 Tax=Austropuccinia psidii MF-1 TaxID=1389203 RepID=A0A9Q3FAM1_9BASI|nr:hypothetical protein [Austropuccinia psidii MF-1]
MDQDSVKKGSGDVVDKPTFYSELRQISSTNLPLYVRLGWEKYTVMESMDSYLEHSIIPTKMAIFIGMKTQKRNKQKKENQESNNQVMSQVRIILSTDEIF